MPRVAREAAGGYVYHVINRGVGRMTLFEDDADYAAFMRVFVRTMLVEPIDLLAYCVMPNHWHLVLRPDRDGQLGRFMQKLTITHVRRWQEHRHRTGEGHVYQGRYKSFPIESDGHLLTVLRYVERNALRAGLVHRAEDWRWSSLWQWAVNPGNVELPALSDWPFENLPKHGRPRNWIARVNQPLSQNELDALRTCVNRGRPFGGESWTARVTRAMGLESTFRSRGRPRKDPSRE